MSEKIQCFKCDGWTWLSDRYGVYTTECDACKGTGKRPPANGGMKLIQINETFAPLDPNTEEFVELEPGDPDTLICPACNGGGKLGDEWCDRCQGEGWVWVEN